MATSSLAPLRGEVMTNDFSGGLRTPTTGYFLCNPSGCAEVSQLYKCPRKASPWA
jgi:hypothetical protein